MLKNYFKTALRNLWKNKITGFINLFGLSVGMTAAVFIFLWVQNELSFDSYHPGKENIYRVTNTIDLGSGNEAWKWETSPYQLGEFAKREIPGIQTIARASGMNSPHVIKFNNKLFPEKACGYVDKNWFSLFKYDFISGSKNNFEQNPFGLILTETKAKKYFGNTDAVGKTMQVDTLNYTVEAVIKDNPVNSSFQFDVLLQLESHLSQPRIIKNNSTWGNFSYTTFVQLHKDANIKSVTAKLNEIMNRKRTKNTATVNLLPLDAMHFETDLQSTSLPHGNKKTTYIFSVLAIMLLVTACINYVNLTTAKASLRAKEVGVRKIVGAERGHLFFQFITESLIISLLSLMLTLALLEICLPAFNALTEKQFALPFSSADMWQLLLGTLLLATILNGIYPAVLLSSFNPLNVFRRRSLLKLSDGAVRKVLVVFQFGLSIVLIIGAIVIFQQLKHIQTTNPGYNLSQVVSLQIPYKVYGKLSPEQQDQFFAAMKHELKSTGTIEGVSAGGDELVDIGSYSSGNVDWDGHDTAFQATVSPLSVDADFQKIFQLKLKEGRWFKEGTEDQHNYILNETAVAMFNMHTPIIGQRFTMGGDTGKVVAVVKDFHFKSMHEKIGALVMNYNAGWDSYFFIKVAAGNIPKALQATEAIWKKFIPTEPFEYSFLDESFARLYKDDIRISKLIFIFSIMAVIIAALGLFGLAAFTAERRTKEIGIRKVLGASVSGLVLLLSKDFIKLVIIALLIASPVAWYLVHKWLEDFAYRIDIGWWMFALAAIFAIGIALITVSSQAIKAALANPVKNLRTE